MSRLTLDQLNETFAIADHLSLTSHRHGIPQIEVENRSASATIALLGAHVMTFQPHGQKPVLWMSATSHFDVGKPIRGGIPICWPWFSSHPTNPDAPNHGLVRTELWDVKDTKALDEGTTQITLGIAGNERSRHFWPETIELKAIVTVGTQLQVELITQNSGQTEFTFTEALHSYYAVKDVTEISIHGLDECTYLDKVEAFKPCSQQGAIAIDAEVDRVYLDTPAECTIDDPGFQRWIHIKKEGSLTTVVWNPWVEKSRNLVDFGDQEYPEMVCVETANTHNNSITLQPGSKHCLRTIISVESVKAP